MNEKFSLKIIQHGKTQQARLVQSGAGMAGQAVVIQAADAARYQLVNVVTLISPAKLQLKRVGDALHLVLPGGDIEAPDLVIQDYFKVKGASLQGSSISGEWMNYDTAGLATNPAPSVAGTDTLSSNVVDKTSNVSLGGEGMVGTFTEHPWLWAGGIAGAAAAGGGGGGGGTTPTGDASPLGVVQAYANGGTTTAPTSAQYASIGLTLPTIAGLTSANVLGTMNALVASKTSTDVATLGQLQTLADNMNAAYIKILAEANGATADATVGVDPTMVDYASVGVIVGTTTQTLGLMNSALGEKVATSVDSLDKLKAIATASDDVMKVAAGITSAAITNADLLALGLKINGANSGITTVQAAALQANLANLESSLGLAESFTTGAAVNTFAKVQALLSLQVMRSFNDDTAAIGSKSQTAPGVSDYTNIGIKSYASLSNTSDASRVDLTDTHFSSVAGFSLQTTLNSALDKLSAGNALIKTDIQSMVDAYYRILQEADGSTTINTDVYADTANDNANATTYNDPTATDYKKVGVTKVDGTDLSVVTATNTKVLALLNDAVGRFDVTKVDTVTELSALEKAAENVFAIAAGVTYGSVSYTGASADADWVAGLTALGVSGVTTSNIAAIKSALTDKVTASNVNAVDTVAELQAIVSGTRIDAFNNDAAAIGSKSATTPTLADWGALVNVNTNLSDTTATSLDSSTYWKTTNPFNGLFALNSALDTYTTSTTMSGLQLKSIADAYGRVLQEADGSRTYNTDVSKVDGSANADLVVADLTNLGVTFLNTAGAVIPANTAATLSAEKNLLLDVIGGLTSTAVDTVTELSDLAKAVDNVVKQAAGGTVTYLDSEWVSALSSLSITGANSSNIAAIKLAITATADDGSAVDSYNELQSIVSMVRVGDYAALHTGYALPTIEDYQALVAQYGTSTDNDLTHYNGSLTLSASAVGGVASVGGGVALAYSNANSLYLSSYNDAINFKQSNAFTGAEVKSMVLAYNSILAEANGTTVDQTSFDPLSSDYLAVGVGTGTSIDSNITTMLSVAEYAAMLTDVVANKTTTQVDQVSELNALASIIVKIQDLEGKTATGGVNYTAITGGALQVSELASLGLDTSNLTNTSYSGSVLVNRLNNVYDNIIAVDHTSSVSRATLDSLAEMQALINNTSGIVI
jgi:hydrogenase maturation factor